MRNANCAVLFGKQLNWWQIAVVTATAAATIITITTNNNTQFGITIRSTHINEAFTFPMQTSVIESTISARLHRHYA